MQIITLKRVLAAYLLGLFVGSFIFSGVSFGISSGLSSGVAPAGLELQSVKVGGDGTAEIHLKVNQIPEDIPTFQVVENRVEFLLKHAKLDKALQEKVELASPHALLDRVVAAQDPQGVVLTASVSGSGQDLKDLRERIRFTKEATGLRVSVAPPAPVKSDSMKELLNEDQKPFSPESTTPPVVTAGFPLFHWLGVSIFVILAALGALLLVRFLKTQAKSTGSRKFLIESLAYHAYGPRMGISLVKIGREFVLLGITPHGITLLSSLPALQAQYEEESRFERGQFKDAVDDEVSRLQKQIGL